jgi:hypothetical protein
MAVKSQVGISLQAALKDSRSGANGSTHTQNRARGLQSTVQTAIYFSEQVLTSFLRTSSHFHLASLQTVPTGIPKWNYDVPAVNTFRRYVRMF